MQPGEATIPARKFFDICKALQHQSFIDLKVKDNARCIVKSKQIKFVLDTTPTANYPL
ncbi:hypothetical protein [Acinetobacter kyonggiensis]|uniref:hypothetical protein n=1 Tax=Acinetobacter kyonggiensis TaxID=595670 RepID=UPI000B85F39D